MVTEEINSIDDLRPGDIGFGPIYGHVGIAIRVALAIADGGAPYQHVFMVTDASRFVTLGPVDNKYVPPMAVEAMPGGAVYADISNRWTKEYCYVRPDYDNVDQAQAVANRSKALIGIPYSYADYLALLAHHMHLPVPHVDRYIKSHMHMICSQLVDCTLTESNWHPFSDKRLPQDVTPSALYYELDRRKPRLVFAYPN